MRDNRDLGWLSDSGETQYLCYSPPKTKASQENDRCYKQANLRGHATKKSAGDKNPSRPTVPSHITLPGSSISFLISPLIRTQAHCRNRYFSGTVRISVAPMPSHPHHQAVACTDATAHPQREHHRTTCYTSCNEHSPGRCRPHSQVRYPDIAVQGPCSRPSFLPPTRHTSCGPFYPRWSACRKNEDSCSVFARHVDYSRLRRKSQRNTVAGLCPAQMPECSELNSFSPSLIVPSRHENGPNRAGVVESWTYGNGMSGRHSFDLFVLGREALAERRT